MVRALAVICAIVLVAGCGDTVVSSPTDRVDLQELLRILPTQEGLAFESSDVVPADVALLQRTFALGAAQPAAVEEYTAIGFREAAIRTWRGRGGALLTVVASRWPDHLVATNVGGGAVEVIPLSKGASAWTPSELRGARGSRVDSGPARSRSLAFAVDSVSIYVHAEGPVTDEQVIRTMDLATRPLLAAVGRT